MIAVLSSASSAYIRFSRAFSASSSFTRLRSGSDITAYLLLHWEYVALLMPCLRQTLATEIPEPPSVRIARIWLSVNRDFFTACPPKLPEVSIFTLFQARGSLRHNLQPSMSRRGNCHDNAVAESFFQLLKRERARRKIYLTRNLAKRDVFDYIEIFYNPKRRHSVSAGMLPVEYERQYLKRLESV